MELFIWFWAFDKRLLCGLKYGIHSFVYIWLVPMVTSVTVLCLTWVAKLRQSENVSDKCLQVMAIDADLSRSSSEIQTLMIVQEGLLISICFASLLSLIVATRIIKNQANVQRMTLTQIRHKTASKLQISAKSGQNTIDNTITAYDHQVRFDTVKSLPSLVLLFLAFANYFFSFRFKTGYEAYILAQQQSSAGPILSSTVCYQTPGAHILATYSLFMVYGIGCIVLFIYALALLLKVANMGSTLLCPICVVSLKKRCQKVPQSFEHYRDEFDFEANLDYGRSSIDGNCGKVTHNASEAAAIELIKH